MDNMAAPAATESSVEVAATQAGVSRHLSDLRRFLHELQRGTPNKGPWQPGSLLALQLYRPVGGIYRDPNSFYLFLSVGPFLFVYFWVQERTKETVSLTFGTSFRNSPGLRPPQHQRPAAVSLGQLSKAVLGCGLMVFF